jgi:hypothetical protein
VNDIEKWASGEAEKRWPATGRVLIDRDDWYNEGNAVGFRIAASLLAKRLLSDEAIEAAARAVHLAIWPKPDWDEMEEEYRNSIRKQERAALSAALDTITKEKS